ncbi:MAG: hypothetical protein KC649_04645 [Candidatus Omnitrophica bacterium]|nr:hypothetical protein [Candidatus Omnitrophota bacterium]
MSKKTNVVAEKKSTSSKYISVVSGMDIRERLDEIYQRSHDKREHVKVFLRKSVDEAVGQLNESEMHAEEIAADYLSGILQILHPKGKIASDTIIQVVSEIAFKSAQMDAEIESIIQGLIKGVSRSAKACGLQAKEIISEASARMIEAVADTNPEFEKKMRQAVKNAEKSV